MSLLELRCRLGYPSGFVLDAEFSVDARITALFGPSGSGKSTILSLIAGLRRPEDGVIRVGGRTLFDSNMGIDVTPEGRSIGYVFQQHLLFPHLTAGENLLYGWKRRPATARRIDPERVVQVLDLGALLERRPNTLSGGQRQCIALGRALLCAPQLLLLDEPLASVDEELKEKVLGYIGQIVDEWEIPTLYVTHNPAEVRRICQWVVRIQSGKIVGAGSPNDVL